MNLFSKLDPVVFIISLVVGIFITYILEPRPTILYQYPTPFNADKIIYEDDVKNCYKYKSKKVQCPTDPSKIHKMPAIQLVRQE